MASFPVTMNKGDILRVNGINMPIRNQITLKRDELGEYYEIDFVKLKVMIDKEKLYDFLAYNGHILEWKLDPKAKFILALMPNGNEINLINYLAEDYNLVGNRVFNVMVVRNDQSFNFRSSNIMRRNKTVHKQAKVVQNPNKFFGDEEIIVLNSFTGHIKDLGQTGGLERNSKKLITLAKDQHNPNAPKYYEVSLNKKGQNGDEFTFIIDETDVVILSSIRVKNPFYQANKDNQDETMQQPSQEVDEDIHNTEYDGVIIKYNDTTVKDEYITIKNPTWHLYLNQYIAIAYVNIYKDQIIRKNMYIHRYLLQDSITDENHTIDHINGNKFDNRRCNLCATNMSIQNMTRGLVSRKKTLTAIINSFVRAGTDTPINLSFENLEFIIYFCENVKTKKGITIRNGFSIEFKPARSGTAKGIEDSSTQAVVFKDNPFLAIKVKLAHAVCIRYLYTCKYDTILKHNVDNKPFANSGEFKSYTEGLITEIMESTYTIDSFMDYMISLRIMKFADHRKTIGIPQASNSQAASDADELENITFNYIQYVKARDKYDIDVPYDKDPTTGKPLRLRKSGLGSSKDTITDGDKKAFALVQRYNAIVEIANTASSTPTPIHTPNLTSNPILSNMTLEGVKFSYFQELRTHTETYINKLVSGANPPYTLESFAEYITKKAANKKINLEVATLKN